MSELLTLGERMGLQVDVAVAVFTRLSMLMLLMPGIGGRSVPVRIRLTLALALMGILLPLVPPLGADRGPLVGLVGAEALVGLILGFTVRVLLFALEITGSIIAQALSLSQLFGVNADGDSASLLASLLTGAAAVLFLTADLDVAAVALLADSFETIPPGALALMDSGAATEEAIRLTAEAFRFGVMLALPFMVVNFGFYLMLGCLNRVMPQLMVTFIGLPAVTLAGMALLTLTIGGLLTTWLLRVIAVLP